MNNVIRLIKKVDEPMQIEMSLTNRMAEMFKGKPFFLELEMMQGEIQDMGEGFTRYKLIITDNSKAEMLREFALKVISRPDLMIGN
jgi:hypothetical protein